MNNLINDLKFALRNLGKSPGFVAVTIVTLALGIGLNIAVFSIVHLLMFQPLPFENEDRIVYVEYKDLDSGNGIGFSYPVFEAFRERQTVFENIVGWSVTHATLGRGDAARMHVTQLVSGDYFQAFGAQPALGRLFTSADDLNPGAHPVVVLGHSCWQRVFSSDPSIIGRAVAINGHDFTVIGVAEERFAGLTTTLMTDLWIPMMMQPLIEENITALEDPHAVWFEVTAVLKPDIDLDTANAELALLSAQMREADPNMESRPEASCFQMTGIGLAPEDRQTANLMVALVMGLVGLILLIACANVANLQLARSTTRRREIGIRLALGSTRFRIIRQLLIESLILALVGGGVGLVVATWAMNAAIWGMPQLPMNVTPNLHFEINGVALAFAFGLSIITGVVFGLAPALQATGIDLVPALKDEDGGRGSRRSRLRNGLVIGQVAVSMMLLVIAGLFVRSLVNSKGIDPGFSHRQTLALQLRLDPNRFDEASGRVFFDQVLARTRELPGIAAAYLDVAPPLGFNRIWRPYHLEGDKANGPNGEMPYHTGWGSVVSPGSFDTLDIALLRGRDFNNLDVANSARVVIVNDVFAEEAWPGQDPLGQRLRFAYDMRNDDWAQVIGVVQTVKTSPFGERPHPYVYRTLSQAWESQLTLLVRTGGDPMAMLPAVRGVLQDLEPNFVPLDARPYSTLISFAFLPSMMAAALCSGLGGLALALAMAGLYGVMSFLVTQRTREIGIRMAIGAEAGDVMRLIMRQGLVLTGIGLGIGLIFALGFSQVLESMLYKVNPSDPATFFVIPLLLLLVSTLAIYLLARRAMNVDPMIALRTE